MSVVDQPRPLLDQAPWTSDAQQLLLHNVSWKDYDALLRILDGRHLRLTYDRGNLEIMTLSPEHERYKNLIRRFIEFLAEDTNLPYINLGSTTFQRRELKRGLEPDECYYFRNYQRVCGLKRIDLSRDPPPDLVVEVDVTHSSLSRMKIYASLGVPEVWRYDGSKLQVFRLTRAGQYEECDHSPTFPTTPIDELVRFVGQSPAEDDMSIIRAFRDWVGQLTQAKPGTRKRPTRKKGK